MLSTLNTLALLRITPLLSSSAAVFYCADQYVLFSTFIARDNERGPKALPGFWSAYLTPSLGFIFGLYSTSAVLGFSNAYGNRWLSLGAAPSSASTLYAAGAALSLAHFLFAPVVAAHIEAIVKDTEGKETAGRMGRWLNVHLLRSLLVDVPGWACFLLATCRSIAPL